MMSTGKTRIAIQGRSEADGMESAYFTENRGDHDQNSLTKYYHQNFGSSMGKHKEPKFVPYEPYKAAVSPIIPCANKYDNIKSPEYVINSQKVSSLASSIIKLNASKTEPSCAKITNSIETENNVCKSNCEEKISMLEEKVNLLMKEKKELETQFKIQAEVNADLKKMLIASLGEDMQLKVQYMTEDKARLGMNALQFFEELRLKNEEIEKLSIQCDVWKSKFEASSVMVDELAGWKVALSRKLGETVHVLDSLLKEHETVSDQLYTADSILKHIQASFSPSYFTSEHDNSPQSLINLANGIQSLSSSIQERLLGKSSLKTKSNVFCRVKQFTPAERSAYQILSDFEDFPTLMKFEINKTIKHSPGTTACHVLPHVCAKDTTVNCCKHCSGEIKLV